MDGQQLRTQQYDCRNSVQSVVTKLQAMNIDSGIKIINNHKRVNPVINQTHVGGNAAPTAAGGGVHRLQLGNDLVQLTNQLRVRGGTEL